MKTILCASFLLGGPLSLLAQDDRPQYVETRFHRVHLRNGNFIDGTLLKQTDKEVLVRLLQGDLAIGEMSIRYDQVDRVELIKMRTLLEKPTVVDKPQKDPDKKGRGDKTTAPVTNLTPREVEDKVMAVLKKARNAPAEEKYDIMKELLPLGAPAATLLTTNLEKFPEVEMTQSVTPLLMEMKVKDTIPILISKLGVNNPAAKASAVGILGSMGDTTVVGDLLPLLQDPSPRVKRAVIGAVTALNSKAAIRHLAELGKDANKEIRREALSSYLALCKRHGEEADIAGTLTGLLDTARGEAKVEVILAIAESRRKETWTSIAPMLKDEDMQVRTLSAATLASLGAREAEDAIVERLGSEPDKNVKTQLADTAAKLKLPKAVGPLVNWLNQDDTQVKAAAMTALRTLTGQNFGLEAQKWMDWWAANRPR